MTRYTVDKRALDLGDTLRPVFGLSLVVTVRLKSLPVAFDNFAVDILVDTPRIWVRRSVAHSAVDTPVGTQ